MRKPKNYAFIDGQNLYLGTRREGWSVDLAKLRVHLRDKYHVEKAYYFLGYTSEDLSDLYDEIQEAGFIVVFREHSSFMKGKKKGNVDSDIIFAAMKAVHEDKDFDKVVILSGDGDYKRLVDYLIKINRFEKILFPNKKFASSLYKKLGSEFYTNLDNPSTKKKIAA